MSEKASTINSYLVEDPIRNVLLERPSFHSEVHSIHPKHNEPFFQRMWACRDALFDPHNEAVNLIKATVKGAVLGGITGTFLTLVFKKYPTFVMKKAMRYINKNNFGNAILLKEVAAPYTLAGAAVGASYWIYWNCFWRKNSPNTLLYDMILGNAIYGAVAVPLLTHPKMWSGGFFIGGLIGYTLFHVYYGNNFSLKDRTQVVLKLKGLSEEERQKQEIKDLIHSFSYVKEIEEKKLIDL